MNQFLDKHFQNILLFLTAFSIFLLGFVSGIVNEKLQKARAAPGIQFLPNVSEEIPLITFDRIENGVLYGENKGAEARFVVGPDAEDIHTIWKGEFSFPVMHILPNLQFIPAPEGMHFAASSRGSKFWPLDAPEAAMLSVKNRVFFATEEEAVAAGYTKGR